MRIGYVEFENIENARDIFSFFNSGSRIPVNENNAPIEVTWGYNRLYSEKWVTIVLRNLPSPNKDSVHTNCTKRGEKVKYITPPTLIKGRWCCLVVVEDIETAEKICLRVNNNVVDKGGRKIRAHIHPSSNMNRDYEKKSHNSLFAYMKEYLPKGNKDQPEKVTIPPVRKTIKKQKIVSPEARHKQIRDSIFAELLDDQQNDVPDFIRTLTKSDKFSKPRQGVILLSGDSVARSKPQI